jgi:hypothetical protein
MVLIKLPLFAAYGAFVVVRGWFSGCVRAGDAARLLSATLPCPSCRTGNDVHGRWRCRSCSAVYHGAVFHCPLCRSGASWFSCSHCGASIPLARPG